ncbi:hypothetical protein ACIBF1_27225 [Spirillospora sp. NPDC050679]
MSTAVMVVVAVVVIAAVAGAGYLVWTRARSRRLRQRFGSEYDRAVERHGGRGAAEKELMSREQRHQELELRELDPGQRERYREQWTRVQEQFVDTPESAVEQADRLVTVVMGDRGYPTGGFDEKVTHLSVEHGRTLDHYRRGHEISARAAGKEATTEELRQAMVHYRALFEDLLRVPADERSAAPSPAGTEHAAGTRGEHGVPGPGRSGHERRDDEQTPRS